MFSKSLQLKYSVQIINSSWPLLCLKKLAFLFVAARLTNIAKDKISKVQLFFPNLITLAFMRRNGALTFDRRSIYQLDHEEE